MILMNNTNGATVGAPNVSTGNYSLYEGDCLEVMRGIPSSSVDLVLCDLPYGTTQNKWDCLIDLSLLWENYNRICKTNAAMVFTAQTPFDKVLGTSNLENLRYEWVWQKNISTGFMNANKMPLKIHENILVFYRTLPVYNPQFSVGTPFKTKRKGKVDTGENYGKVGITVRTDTINDGKRYPNTILYFPREIGLHPTQKPVPLFEYLIRTYTNEGAVVLDSCMGSGTTGVACVRSGRSFLGIEKDHKYFETARQRIEETKIDSSLHKASIIVSV